MPKVSQVERFSIAVRSLDEAIPFFRDVLGAEVSERVQIEDYFFVVCTWGQTRIELLQPASEDSVIAKFLNAKGEGIYHVTLQVDDLEQALADVRERGLRITARSSLSGIPGYRSWDEAFLHPKESHGVLFSLAEIHPEGE
jgi:methylmalonyl-CoA epimerase